MLSYKLIRFVYTVSLLVTKYLITLIYTVFTKLQVCIINITYFFRHLDDKGKSGFALILMDMFVAANYDLYVWEYCKTNFLLTVAIPKCICVSIRIFNMGPMRKYASYMSYFAYACKTEGQNGISRLISTLCVNCLSSIPEYSRLNHLDEYLV